MSRKYEAPVDVPVAYFTQLMGMAFGLDHKKLGLKRLFVPVHAPAAVGGSHVAA